ncbi:MAG: outer membrane lipoprotein carrier protein LolA [Bacteroidetes bacterium]|nr:outer membrane lipoprotein carrier protein LolA [Bacteroidia bacterium]MBN8696751.1 outer membrane lipoprotein carrier protein LolA [Bacteroidota bacterium]
MNKFLFVIIFFLLSISISAQVPAGYKPVKDTAAFKQQMQAQSKLVNTIESDFTQEKYLSVMSEKIITKGHFLFKKVNMLRWEYTDPLKYLIAINKDKMFIKDNGKVSKYDINSNKMFKSINEMMVNTVQGNLLNNKDYKAKYYENEKFYLLELSPLQKGAKDFLKVIQLYIDKKDYAVVKVKMIEPSDDYTMIDFSNRKTNQPIGDEKFIVK